MIKIVVHKKHMQIKHIDGALSKEILNSCNACVFCLKIITTIFVSALKTINVKIMNNQIIGQLFKIR